MTFPRAAQIFLRSALFNAVFYVNTAALTLFVGLPLILMSPIRMLALGEFWARTNLAALRVICGIKLVVIGREHLPTSGPALIASQHQSAFDTMVWLTLLPRCCYVLKLELIRIPLFGAVVSHTGMIAVDRASPVVAMRHLLREGRRAKAESRQIVIFPEGTRASPGSRLTLQPGVAALADATGLQVIPVATDSGERWSRRGFSKWPGKVHVAIQPPIESGLRRQALLDRLAAALDAGAAAIAACKTSGG